MRKEIIKFSFMNNLMTLKEQKVYLLSEIDRALTRLDVTSDNKIIITIPNLTVYKINPTIESLEAFKKMVIKKFPVTAFITDKDFERNKKERLKK